MTVLVMRDADADAVIAERRARGIDVYDEMHGGVYVVVPAGTRRHGRLQMALGALLRERVGPPLEATGPINLGEQDDYRIPDVAVIDPRESDEDDTWIPGATLVGEVRSTGDETYEKFDHYGSHGVEEIIIVLPACRTVEVWNRRPDGAYARGETSTVLGMSAASIWQRIS